MTVALVPVRALDGAKSRLGAVLDPEERRELVVEMLERTLDALLETSEVARTIVVSPDEAVLEIARAHAALPLRQTGGDLNAALDQAREAAVDLGAEAIVAVAGDLPGVDAPALRRLLSSLPSPAEAPALVALVADRHGLGTNALLLRPPSVIPFAFGIDSRHAHRRLAEAAGAIYAERDGVLAIDLDTPEDLLAAGMDLRR